MTKTITRFFITDDDRRFKSIDTPDGRVITKDMDADTFVQQVGEMIANEELECSFAVDGLFYKSCMTFVEYQS